MINLKFGCGWRNVCLSTCAIMFFLRICFGGFEFAVGDWIIFSMWNSKFLCTLWSFFKNFRTFLSIGVFFCVFQQELSKNSLMIWKNLLTLLKSLLPKVGELGLFFPFTPSFQKSSFNFRVGKSESFRSWIRKIK